MDLNQVLFQKVMFCFANAPEVIDIKPVLINKEFQVQRG